MPGKEVDGGVFAIPGSITGLLMAKNVVNPETDVDMNWNSQAALAGAATVYDVIAGKLAGVMGGGLVPDNCPGNAIGKGEGNRACSRVVCVLYGSIAPKDRGTTLDRGNGG